MFKAQIQSELALYNLKRFRPDLPSGTWMEDLVREIELRLMEGEMLENARAEVSAQAAAAPTEPEAFVKWFEDLKRTGPGQGDALFPWLAHKADLPSMRWFVRQEVAAENGFDDLVALTLLKLPEGPKLELARNFWDEMGRGKVAGMHGKMLARLSSELSVPTLPDPIVTESLALGNLLAGLAANRAYAYHSLGALGVVELTAPDRARQVAQGLKRLGVSPDGQRYFALHAVLDVKHAETWKREVFVPLLREEPARARAFAEGALMRLQAGAHTYARYRAVLWTEERMRTPSLGAQWRGESTKLGRNSTPSAKPRPNLQMIRK